MEKDLDKKLYNDYLNGEKSAFDILYNKYKSRIEYFIYNIVHDYQKAEDLTQETFIYVMQNGMKENYTFKYYIYLKAKLLALNFINVENRRNEIAEKYLFNKDERVEKDIFEIISQEETKKEILEAIELLDEKYKNAIYLTNIEELSYKETAEILGQTLSNTKKIVYRGKQKLRNILVKKGFNEMNKVAKIFITIICISAVLSGLVYATTVIYKEYIKKQDSVEADKNFYTSEEFNEDFIFEKKIDARYKIITDSEEFNNYKRIISELPEISEIDFDNNFLIIISQEYYRMPHIRTLEISKIISDEMTTYITLKQKDTPDLDKSNNIIIYAIADKSLLKENIDLTIEEPNMKIEGLMNIENLPDDYSVEDAIKDGCFVVEDNVILSENKNALDELIKNSKLGIETSLRMYIKNSRYRTPHTEVIDVKCQDDIYIFNTYDLSENMYYRNNIKPFFI